MDEDDKRRIRSNFRYLVGQIRVSDIRDYLYEKGVLNDDDFEELEPGRRTERNCVRMLLGILTKKGPNAYAIFCDALNENNYGHIVKKLQDTDLTVMSKESESELNQFLDEENKIAEFQRILWKTTEQLEQYKREVDDLKKQLESKEELDRRYQILLKQITEKGYNEEFIIKTINNYMSKVQQDHADCSETAGTIDNSQGYPVSGSASRNQIGRIALELSRDIVRVMKANDSGIPEPNKYAKTMRRTVKLMIDSKESDFESCIRKLSIHKDNGFDILGSVADEMFSDGHNNWGRIVALYAFGGFVARHTHQQKMTSISEYIGDYLGDYVTKNLSGWIEKNGGWDDFERFFGDTGNQSGIEWSAVFLTAIGLGVLVSLASVRGSV